MSEMQKVWIWSSKHVGADFQEAKQGLIVGEEKTHQRKHSLRCPRSRLSKGAQAPKKQRTQLTLPP